MTKISLVSICLTLLLIFAGCFSPQSNTPVTTPGSDSVPPSSASSSQPELNYFVEKVEDNGIEDREAVDALYWYLYENLTPAQYQGVISTYSSYPVETYIVYFSGPDKAPVEKLLEAYTGPWAPIYFEASRFTQAELMRAEADVKYFLKAHPEITDVVVIRDDLTDYILLVARKPSDDLAKFVENYPRKGIFLISVEDPDIVNPD